MKLSGNSGRILSGFFLCAALIMLLLGLTLFSNQLSKAAFVIYWLICFVLTGVAALVALIDIALIRRKQRQEQRNLIAETMREAEKEKTEKPPLDL